MQATYFDGRSARAHAVELDIRPGALALAGDALLKTYALAQARMAEPFAHSPCVLDFDDGGRLEVADPAARPALEQALGYRPTRVQRWQHRWPVALLSLVLLAASLFAAVKWGIPALGERLLPRIPASIDQQIGDRSLAAASGKVLFPSRLSDQRIAEVDAVFQRILPATTRIPVHMRVMEFRNQPPNALTLPNGTIIMTDAMVVKIMNGQTSMDAHMQAELAGVFAHEIGHVQGRHSMRALLRYSLTTIASMSLFGDFSSLAGAVPALLLHLDFSRDMEREADRYAIARLHEAGLPSAPLADLFEAMSKPGVRRNEGGGYLDSHPATTERIALFRQADAKK